jgi:hypothetical protein
MHEVTLLQLLLCRLHVLSGLAVSHQGNSANDGVPLLVH